MKFDSKCHLSTKLFAEHSKIASQPINWKVNKCHFVVLVVNKCHFVVLVVNKCHFVVLVVNKCHFVVLVVNKCHFVVIVVRKRSRNDFTLLKRVLKLCNNVANYGTNYSVSCWALLKPSLTQKSRKQNVFSLLSFELIHEERWKNDWSAYSKLSFFYATFLFLLFCIFFGRMTYIGNYFTPIGLKSLSSLWPLFWAAYAITVTSSFLPASKGLALTPGTPSESLLMQEIWG